MSKLNELIQELCPNSVPFVKLKDVCAFRKGASLSKADKGLGDIPIILYGELYTTYGDYINKIISFTSPERAQAATPAHKGSILLPVSSTTKDAQIGKASALNVDYPVYIGGDAIILEHQQEPGYLVHLLNSHWFKVKKMKCVHGTTIMHLHPKEIAEICIPVPPLEVQREIVRILDNFTELTVELTAELTARKSQYDFYKDLLFNRSKDNTIKTLDDLCFISAGGDVPKDEFSEEQNEEFPIPIISNGVGKNAIYGYTNKAKIKHKAVTVAARGTIGYAGYRDYPYYPIVRLISLIPKNEEVLLPKYLYYYLQGRKYSVPQAGIPQLTVPMIKTVEIPIPSLTEQKRIVSILDRFDTLCNDNSAGLPAEIEARQKQYEYYREKLLTFKEIEA